MSENESIKKLCGVVVNWLKLKGIEIIIRDWFKSCNFQHALMATGVLCDNEKKSCNQ